MRTRWLGPALAALLCARVAHADGDAKADALFEEAKTLMLAGHHAEACPKLEESQRIEPAVGTLLYLGECFAKTGRTASAWTTFREAIVAARKAGQTDRERVALERAQAIEPSVAKVLVAVSAGAMAPGLVIRRDGVVLDATARGAAIPADPGPHVIEASAPGRQPFRIEIDAPVEGGTVVVAIPALSALPPPAPSAPPPVAPPAPAPPPPRPARTAAYVGLGFGAASIVAGSVFGAVAIRRWSDSRSHCPGDVCDGGGYDQATSARTAARVSTGFFAAGAAVVAGSAVVLWTTRDRTAGAFATPTVGGVLLGASGSL